LRFPTIATKTQYHRAGLVLTKKFNVPSLQILGPHVADSLVIGKIARSGNDQARARSIEERFGAGFSEVMLPFDNDVAAEIQVAGQQCLFGSDATIRHKQHRRRWPDQQVDNVRLIISHRRAEATRRKQNIGRDVA
jgi:hypothetical protein